MARRPDTLDAVMQRHASGLLATKTLFCAAAAAQRPASLPCAWDRVHDAWEAIEAWNAPAPGDHAGKRYIDAAKWAAFAEAYR